MAKTCNQLIQFITQVNLIGGVRKLDNLYEDAICDCIDRLGGGVGIESLGFDNTLQKTWSDLKVIAVHNYRKLDLSKVWADLPGATQALLETINEKLR